eukprot:6175815-Pleurochrysis_carterae.AAC.2
MSQSQVDRSADTQAGQSTGRHARMHNRATEGIRGCALPPTEARTRMRRKQRVGAHGYRRPRDRTQACRRGKCTETLMWA